MQGQRLGKKERGEGEGRPEGRLKRGQQTQRKLLIVSE